MSRRFLGRVIFLRHGQSKYTDIYPDITEKGVETITKSANLIKLLLNNSSAVIITSPAARAQGSAAVIARIIKYQDKIRKEPAIEGAIFNNKILGQALFNEHVERGGIRALDMAYGTDSRYENSEIVEPRSKVRKRFFEYLAKLTNALLKRQSPLDIICVSHYEILYHFVEHLFELDYTKDEPLGHGEIIAVSIFDVGLQGMDVDVVEIEVTFRKKIVGQIRRKFFNYKQHKII